MKIQLLVVLLCLLISQIGIAQHNNSELPTSINSSGAAPDASAMFDVQSTSKGMLIPRMSTGQRTGIVAAAKGLLVYDLTTESFWFHDIGVWVELVADRPGNLDDEDWAATGGGSPALNGEIYHTGGIATGAFTSPDNHGINAQNYYLPGGKSAVRGVNQNAGSIYSEGNLGILNADVLGVPIAAWNVGVLGIRTATSGSNGAGIYGWNADDENSLNYGGLFVADGSGPGTNYGVYSTASNGGTNLAGYFDGKVAIDGGDEASMTADGHLRIDASTGENMVIDGDEITTRNNGLRETLFLNPDSGRVTIGSSTEWNDASLHVNAKSGEGVLRMQVNGSTRFYMNSEGTTVIGGYLSSGGPVNGLYVLNDTRLGTSSGNARLDVSNSVGIDRDTMIYVNQNSSNTTGTHYGVRVNNNPSTTSSSYGFYHERLSGANGIRYGYRSLMSGGTGTRYGVSSSISSAAGNTSPAYGVYSFVSSGATTGSSYAGYFSSSTGTGKWSIYAIGDSYFSSDVRIATTAQATGYELSVNGQIAAEEVLIQDSGSWPDYVFAKDYKLPTLKEVEAHINEKGHLPNVPSAQEIEANGIQLGEMQRTFMEKIEELVLYTLQQEKELEGQSNANADLLNKVDELTIIIQEQNARIENLESVVVKKKKHRKRS